MATSPKPHRPSLQDSISLEALGQRNDPIERRHIAHETASMLLAAGHDGADPSVVERMVSAVDEIGLPTLADLWEPCPAQSLPGALYRLYVIREWIDQQSEDVAREHAAGIAVEPAASGDVMDPPAVRRMADEILRGAFTGDVAVAFERAAAFCAAVAAGRHARGEGDVTRLSRLADDLTACAALHRADDLE